MTDLKLPHYNDLHLPTLVALNELGGSARIAELDETVAHLTEMTDEALGKISKSINKNALDALRKDMGWARTNLKKIGAANNSELGVWSITKEGRRYLSLEKTEAHAELKQKAANYWKKGQKDSEINSETIENIETEEVWNFKLLSTLKNMDPIAFERLAMHLLREAGFRNVEVTRPSKDGGIDGTGIYEISPLVSMRICFQCKRYDGSVGSDAVQKFRGAMGGAGKNVEKGILITTGNFTQSARKDAEEGGPPYVDLIDGNKLCQLLYDFKLGVEIQENPTINQDFFDNI